MTATLNTPAFTAAKPRAANLMSRVQQSIDGTYNDRDNAALAGDWQQVTIDGSMPYVTRHIVKANEQIKDVEALLPDNLQITRRVVTGGKTVEHDEILAVGSRINVLMQVNRSNQVNISVAGATLEEAREALLETVAKVPTDAVVPQDILDAYVWFLGKSGPNSRLKKITVPAWDEISRNYVPEVIDPLGRMMNLSKPTASGKIILWHGPPGTGKTTALRAMAREWKDWCTFHYISDPERLFESPEYLMEACSTPSESAGPYYDEDDEEDTKKPKWRLVVAEDSDEFLRLDARAQSGAALGRLLNFSDGILGQGSNTLILLTTNEEVHKLHPAVTRPGRCLAQIEFRKFSPDQARSWSQNEFSPSNDVTLAEMIDKTQGTKAQIATGIKTESFGTYL